MSTKILGVSGAIEQPKVYGFRYGVGPFTRRRFECTSVAAAQAVANTLVGAGYSWTITEGPKPLVEAEIQTDDVSGGGGEGTPEVPEIVWEFLGNVAVKKITDADSATVKKLTADDKQKLTAEWEKRQNNSAIPNLLVTGSDSGARTDTLTNLYKLLLRGSDGVQKEQPILKRTMIVSRKWQTAASMAKVGSILKTATLIADESVPAMIPVTTAAFPDGEPANVSDGIKAFYGWRKGFPQIVQTGSQKTQISQTWEYGIWPEVLYGSPI